MTEKRQFERAAFDGQVTIQHESDTFAARVRDLSVGGAYVVSDRKLPHGAAVQMTIALPALVDRGKPAALLEGVVRWVRADGFSIQFARTGALATYAIADYVARRTNEL